MAMFRGDHNKIGQAENRDAAARKWRAPKKAHGTPRRMMRQNTDRVFFMQRMEEEYRAAAEVAGARAIHLQMACYYQGLIAKLDEAGGLDPPRPNDSGLAPLPPEEVRAVICSRSL
jgi:hypothetical protein